MSDLLSSQVKPNTQDFMSLIALKKHTLKYLLLAYFEGEIISFRATESTKRLSAISTAAPCINWF